ncbi:ATP-dependent DNA helicase PIF1-like protein [Tanacetum coccineum]
MEVIAGKGDTYANMDKLCVSFSPVMIQTHKLLIENLIFNQVRHTKVMTRALEMIPLAPSSSGMHVPRAVFVDLEPSVIDEVGNRRIRILAFRMLVRGLREKAQTWLQYLPVSTGVNFSCRAIQQCAIKSFPIKTYYCLAETRADIRNSENEIHVVGLFLQRRVFSHGRLYVVVSRVKSKKGLKGHTLSYNTSSLDDRKYSSLALANQSLDHLETKLYD